MRIGANMSMMQGNVRARLGVLNRHLSEDSVQRCVRGVSLSPHDGGCSEQAFHGLRNRVSQDSEDEMTRDFME